MPCERCRTMCEECCLGVVWVMLWCIGAVWVLLCCVGAVWVMLDFRCCVGVCRCCVVVPFPPWARAFEVPPPLPPAPGLGIQGVVPLQSDVLELMKIPRRPGVTLAPQSIVHQTGAAVLFVASLVHQVAILRLYWKCARWRSMALRQCAGCSMLLKGLALALALGTIVLSLVWHPASGGRGSASQMTYGAVMQWLLVGALLLFFGSYTLDLYQARVLHLQGADSE